MVSTRKHTRSMSAAAAAAVEPVAEATEVEKKPTTVAKEGPAAAKV